MKRSGSFFFYTRFALRRERVFIFRLHRKMNHVSCFPARAK
ncbi:MAG: hypothetical protein U5L45_02920 [Saprospiraceae bacterium]|nr:hypothetical protein [Saprospiraceae bacterium]